MSHIGYPCGMPYFRCPVSHVPCQVPHVAHPMRGSPCAVSRVGCPVCSVLCEVPPVLCPVRGAPCRVPRCAVSHAGCPMQGAPHRVLQVGRPHVPCPMRGVPSRVPSCCVPMAPAVPVTPRTSAKPLLQTPGTKPISGVGRERWHRATPALAVPWGCCRWPCSTAQCRYNTAWCSKATR